MDIIEIDLQSEDLAGTKQFYTHVLSLPVIKENGNSISFAVGKSLLTFHTGKAENPVYHFAFNVPSNSIEKALDWLGKKAEPILLNGSPIFEFDAWNARAIYFYDNNRNILEFIARMDLDNPSDKDFDSGSILSISEIAVVVDQVHGFITQLDQSYAIPVFPKQAEKENFAACGNDHGLIIISHEGRNWFPTDVVARKFPLHIRLSNNGEIQTLHVHN